MTHKPIDYTQQLADLVEQLKRIADSLAKIEPYIDCSSANWGRGF